jgi:hypothetical protein
MQDEDVHTQVSKICWFEEKFLLIAITLEHLFNINGIDCKANSLEHTGRNSRDASWIQVCLQEINSDDIKDI